MAVPVGAHAINAQLFVALSALCWLFLGLQNLRQVLSLYHSVTGRQAPTIHRASSPLHGYTPTPLPGASPRKSTGYQEEHTPHTRT